MSSNVSMVFVGAGTFVVDAAVENASPVASEWFGHIPCATVFSERY